LRDQCVGDHPGMPIHLLWRGRGFGSTKRDESGVEDGNGVACLHSATV
jgi:hypothetical protein